MAWVNTGGESMGWVPDPVQDAPAAPAAPGRANPTLTQQDFQFYNQQHAPSGYVDWGKDALIQYNQYLQDQGPFAGQTDAQLRKSLGLTDATQQQQTAFQQAASTQGSDLAKSQVKKSSGILGLGPEIDMLALGAVGIATGGFGLAGLMGEGAVAGGIGDLAATDIGVGVGAGATGASAGIGDLMATDIGVGTGAGATGAEGIGATDAGVGTSAGATGANAAVTPADYQIPPELQNVPNNPLQTGAEPGLGKAAMDWVKANPWTAASLGLTAAGLVSKFGSQPTLKSGIGQLQPGTIRPSTYVQARNPNWQPIQQGQIYKGGTPFQNQAFVPGDPFQVAQGGAIPGGGIASLGGYSDGGRMVRGPGTGLSDDIPARINGQQEARLADGEFVLSSDIVSALGGGSTEAGSRKLYAMVDRIRQQAHGTKKQIKPVSDKVLPK